MLGINEHMYQINICAWVQFCLQKGCLRNLKQHTEFVQSGCVHCLYVNRTFNNMSRLVQRVSPFLRIRITTPSSIGCLRLYCRPAVKSPAQSEILRKTSEIYKLLFSNVFFRPTNKVNSFLKTEKIQDDNEQPRAPITHRYRACTPFASGSTWRPP